MTELYRKYRECGCRVTTDSRAVEGGELFFAIRGENFDGNAYALSALEKGAAWAVVNAGSGVTGERVIPVDDPFAALQALAIEHRESVSEGSRLPVIGLTGTNGKTTTKELIAAVLGRRFRVCATEGNLNNDLGVPLSLLKIRPDTEIAVIEMGASHPDDIAKLVRVSRPDYGLITNVGKAHLLGFGSFEGVKAAKGELYKWLGSVEGSVIFLNEDDADLRSMAASQPCHCFGYGLGYQGASLLPSSASEPYLRLKLADGTVVNTRLVGSYNAPNVLAALAVGSYFGVSQSDAVAAVEAYEPHNRRSQMVSHDGNTYILDAYNANPSSMAAALDNFDSVQAERKVVLLGDMRELGEDSLSEHVKVVRRLVSSPSLEIYLVGSEFGKALSEPGIVSGTSSLRWFSTSAELGEYLNSHPITSASILVKGSRSIRMEDALPFQ